MTPAPQKGAPLAVRGWPGPLPEEHPHQQALLMTVVRWCFFVGPITTGIFGALSLRHPVWPARLLALGSMTVSAVAVWSFPRVRRGELRATARLLLALSMFLVTVQGLSLDDREKVMVPLGLASTALLAIALEPPVIALGWAGAAVASLAASFVLPRLVELPRLGANAAPWWVLDLSVVQTFLIIALLGRSTTRYLREALAASEHARFAVERSNVQLAEQRATLKKAQVDLASSASSLEASNRELASFAEVVSRDLLAPVRTLEGDTEHLHERYAAQLDAEGREHIQGIADSARHMDALVTGLLAYSSAGQPRAEPEPVDLGALFERVATALDLRSQADVTLPPELPTVWGHPLRLEQVFANLIENAVKFQRPGARPAVAIEWQDQRDAWELAVRDNGIGIDPRHFEKIFGIFQRLHLQSEYEGTGIGLAIVQKVVEEHGGKVWVESAPGEGSTFRFTLRKPLQARAAAVGSEEGPLDKNDVETSPAVPRLMPIQEEPVREGDPLERTSEGARLRRATVASALRSLLVVSPVFAAMYLAPVAQLRTWAALPPVVGAALVMLASAWAAGRVRRGEVMLPARALLGVVLIVVVDHLLHREDEVRMTGSLGFAFVVVMATAIERAELALRWTALVSALYVGTSVLRHLLPMRSLSLGPFGLDVVRFTPVVQLVPLLLLGLTQIRLLRQALARSRATRGDLERANADLQRERAELLLAQARLSTLTANLTRSNRDLRSFAYVASHDLRAPLRALSNYSRFLREDCAAQLDEEGRRLVERIGTAARRMDALVADLLEYSRIGRVHLEPEWVDLGPLVPHVLAARGLEGKARVAMPPDLPTVWGIRARLEQMFGHLLANAVKFRREEVEPAIVIDWADRGDAWELSVGDNGIGIAEKDFETIFRLFGQLHPERDEGTGIGLPIAKKAVEEHGGKLWVESIPGQGSVFRFTLPKHAGAARSQERW